MIKAPIVICVGLTALSWPTQSRNVADGFYNFEEFKGANKANSAGCTGLHSSALRLMDKILHDPKDPKLWEL